MKRIYHIIFIIILCFSETMVSCAESVPVLKTTELFSKECFQVVSKVISSHSNEDIMVLAGIYRDKQTVAAAMYAIDAKGSTKWEVVSSIGEQSNQNQSESYEQYYDSFQSIIVYEDQIIALRLRGLMPYSGCQYITIIENGMIVNEIEIPIVDGIFPANDGIFCIRASGGEMDDSNNPDNRFTMIEKRDGAGSIVWNQKYPYYWIFEDMISTSEGYLAYGTESTFPEKVAQGVLVMFDENGNILWNLTNEEVSQFTQCIWQDDNVMAIGNSYPSAKHNEVQSYICSYSDKRLDWQHKLAGGANWVLSFAEADNGYITTILRENLREVIIILLIGQDGVVEMEYQERIGDVSSQIVYCEIVDLSDSLYIVASVYRNEAEMFSVLKRIE